MCYLLHPFVYLYKNIRKDVIKLWEKTLKNEYYTFHTMTQMA